MLLTYQSSNLVQVLLVPHTVSWLKVDLARNDKTLILIIEYKNSGTLLMLL